VNARSSLGSSTFIKEIPGEKYKNHWQEKEMPATVGIELKKDKITYGEIKKPSGNCGNKLKSFERGKGMIRLQTRLKSRPNRRRNAVLLRE